MEERHRVRSRDLLLLDLPSLLPQTRLCEHHCLRSWRLYCSLPTNLPVVLVEEIHHGCWVHLHLRLDLPSHYQ